MRGLAWHTLERCRQTHDSVSTMLRCRSDLPENDSVVRRNGTRWAALELDIYCSLQLVAFRKCVKVNLNADPSTYQGQDTTASILYSMENNLACVGVTCTTPMGKHVNPDDWGGLPNDVMVRVMNRKAERLKSLKEWTTMSYILLQTCDKTSDSYAIPSSCAIRRPMSHPMSLQRRRPSPLVLVKCRNPGNGGSRKMRLVSCSSWG